MSAASGVNLVKTEAQKALYAPPFWTILNFNTGYFSHPSEIT